MTSSPPAFKGGQGRSDESVREDAAPLLIGLAVLGCILLWVLLYWACI